MARQYQDLSRFRLPPDFRGRPAWLVQIWWMVQETLFAWSPQALFGWRNFLLRLFGAKVGHHVQIRSTARVTFPWKVVIGDYVWIGEQAQLYSLGPIEIGSHVSISHRTYLCTGSHDYTKPEFDIYTRKITIEDEVWLANEVFVGPGVTIGRGAVLAVRSTALKDMPAGMLCYGTPAVAVRPRNQRD